jgi:hypothetical protein
LPEAAQADLPVDEDVESHPPGTVEPLQSQTGRLQSQRDQPSAIALQSNKVMERGGFLTLACTVA